MLYHSLKEDFARAAGRGAAVGQGAGGIVPARARGDVRRNPPLRDQLGTPYCGPVAAFESREWFEDGDALKSFAFLPLRTAQTFGLLALGSPDPQRFHPGMGTLFLTRLAELASVATARFLPP